MNYDRPDSEDLDRYCGEGEGGYRLAGRHVEACGSNTGKVVACRSVVGFQADCSGTRQAYFVTGNGSWSARYRVGNQASVWVFPSDSRCGHTTTVAKAFQNARKAAGLSEEIVLYSGRHSFGTKLLASTGNLSLVMRAMGHSSVQATMVYQHPDIETVRRVMNGNTTETTLRHKAAA